MSVLALVKYFIPSILFFAFVLLSGLGYYWLILPVLLGANLFNAAWGEFTSCEIKQESINFYGNKAVTTLKRVSAVCLLCMLVWTLWFVDRQQYAYSHLVLFGICTGCLTGCFIVTLAHDLLHSRQKTDQYLSALLLTGACIPHLAADHVFGHHRNIGLKEDVNTAKVNQDFYSYFVVLALDRLYQSYFRQFNLPRHIRKKIFRLNIKMLTLFFGALLLIGLLAANPASTLLFFLIQGFVAYILYELINYIQHYGLTRNRASEPITLHLSWNCYYKYTNYILHFLPLHSVHHLPHHHRKLGDSDLKDGPRMPYLYFAMVFMALVPPLWFSKMNGLAQQVKTKAYVA